MQNVKPKKMLPFKLNANLRKEWEMAKSVASKIDKEIGRRIQQRRRELGLSADTLAEKIGVSQQQFSRYERGKAKINAGHLADIAVVLDKLNREQKRNLVNLMDSMVRD